MYCGSVRALFVIHDADDALACRGIERVGGRILGIVPRRCDKHRLALVLVGYHGCPSRGIFCRRTYAERQIDHIGAVCKREIYGFLYIRVVKKVSLLTAVVRACLDGNDFDVILKPERAYQKRDNSHDMCAVTVGRRAVGNIRCAENGVFAHDVAVGIREEEARPVLGGEKLVTRCDAGVYDGDCDGVGLKP